MQSSSGELNGQETLQRFLQRCDMIDDILRHVATKNLQGIRIPFSFSRLLQFCGWGITCATRSPTAKGTCCRLTG